MLAITFCVIANMDFTVSLTAKGFIHKYTVCVDHL